MKKKCANEKYEDTFIGYLLMIITGVLVLLKVTAVIDWSWWIVTLPLWSPLLLAILIAFFMSVIMIIKMIIDYGKRT